MTELTAIRRCHAATAMPDSAPLAASSWLKDVVCGAVDVGACGLDADERLVTATGPACAARDGVVARVEPYRRAHHVSGAIGLQSFSERALSQSDSPWRMAWASSYANVFTHCAGANL